MHEPQVMVVGGYGQVGQAAALHLLTHTDCHIIVAGRNLQQAQRFCEKHGPRMTARFLDAQKPETHSPALKGVDLVVVCAEQSDTHFLQGCIQQGIHCLDVTATPAYIREAEKLHPQAREAGTTVLLSVGLAPGLSNLLARHATSHLDSVEKVDLTVMLGLGEHHGKMAVQWTVENLMRPFEVQVAGQVGTVPPFSQGRTARFPHPYGHRRAYRFNFSDQHVLTRTLPAPEVHTRLCFDSRGVTNLLAFLSRVGVFPLLERLGARSMLEEVFGRFHVGSEVFGLSVEARGTLQGQKTVWQEGLLGRGEGQITGQMAGWSAAQILRQGLPGGVFHSEQVLSAEGALQFAATCGVQLHLGG
ncbi:saccharopine dehydrogenase NADP-binding domain-containing protein [Deinococcus cellulosilyticus]|uniref:Saccharopine dehydrogenase NADP binding domain-containing protein n=1 Tax=Deinococcus cellulosilyticus (strain DSM 18568 / NBRC 106333 / KACC 11606 / 5516J-15) TaxID=1223518 RepID=A0A511NAF2_DEIC1|nr:saccharopine dehydrogenase NADP-binding domain-containing protein [Deinococcus cellulosilyticus]GEM49547.1 hypothetical protein DC3_51820 [Deinococcus cellulosilyticus NBRC 106333 = KACC 11606]